MIVGAYLVGAFPTGILLARARGVDLRQVGSGNIGATNVGRALGKRWAILVLLVDAAKGRPRCWWRGRWIWGPGSRRPARWRPWSGTATTSSSRGQGAKGVATSLGAALAISPPAAGIAFLLYVLIYLAVPHLVARIPVGDRFVSRRPCGCWARVTPPTWRSPPSAAIVVLVRHRENLRRLVRGEELKA